MSSKRFMYVQFTSCVQGVVALCMARLNKKCAKMSCFFYYLLRVSLYDSWDLKDVVIKKCSKYLPGVALCFTDAELYCVNIKFDQVLDL